MSRIVATTATYRPWNRASAQRPDMRGRPGINPFPFSNTYTVDGTTFDALKRMNRELGFEQARARNKQHFYSEAEVGARTRGRARSVRRARSCAAKRFGQTAAGSKLDIEDNLRWIREARRQADWVVVELPQP